jgi:predicted RNase H-like HicB family nuclease
MEGNSLNYTVLIEQDEDGIYIAKVPDILGASLREKRLNR